MNSPVLKTGRHAPRRRRVTPTVVTTTTSPFIPLLQRRCRATFSLTEAMIFTGLGRLDLHDLLAHAKLPTKRAIPIEALRRAATKAGTPHYHRAKAAAHYRGDSFKRANDIMASS